MFCNGPKTDEGDIARLEPTIIMGWRSQGFIRPWLWLWTMPVVWLAPLVAPLFMVSSIPQTDAGIWGVLFTFARMHILWLGVTRYFICIYVSFLLLHPFFFFFWHLGLCSALMAPGGVAHVVATCLTPIGWEASFPVGTFSVSRIFQGQKGLLILTSHFCFFSLSLFSYFPSPCGVSNFLRCTFRPSSSQFPPDFKVCSLFKLYFLSDCLSFEFPFFFFFSFSAFSFGK